MKTGHEGWESVSFSDQIYHDMIIITIMCVNDSGTTNAEVEITVGHQPFSDQFPEQIQFTKTNLLHIFNGEANNSL